MPATLPNRDLADVTARAVTRESRFRERATTATPVGPAEDSRRTGDAGASICA